MDKKFTKEMKVADILKISEKAADVLEAVGMGCLGCPASLAENLEDACEVHGLNVEDVLKQLQEAI